MSKDILCNIKLCDRNAYCKKIMYLGMFDTKVEAAKAYNIHAAKRFGEFAKLNVFSKESKE